MNTPGDKLKGQRALLRFLRRHGRIAPDDTARIEQIIAMEGISVHEALEREGFISEKDLAVLLAGTLRLSMVDLSSFIPDQAVIGAVKESLATKYEVVPLRLDARSIDIATANPLDIDALRMLEFSLGRKVHAAVATRTEVRTALAATYRLEESLEQFLKDAPPSDPLAVMELKDEDSDLRTAIGDSQLPPVVKLADLILTQGIKSRASDIHVEPSADAIVVRYRLDGVLEEGFRLPKWVQNPLISRFKVLARLDITERRVPQDGRIQVRFNDGVVDMRVSVLPAQHGEKITLRILDVTRGVKRLDEIGFRPADLQRVRDAACRPEGMILVTGPTGSGKTTTLYALIREIMSPTLNVVTIENPIEYQIRGITQVQVNEKQGLTFASVLRSTLRQDPDVILVGEIRDKETAQIALQAAQTGHLVLSTLHTNDAAATATRLLDLGVESYLLASSLNIVLAQRLVRKVCPACSAPYELTDETRRLLRLEGKTLELRRGTGCPACRQTGFAGRIGVFEVLPISAAIAQLIESGAGEVAIRQQAQAEGAQTLLEDALAKLTAGITMPEEVLRVVQVSDSGPRCPSCQQSVEDHFAVCPHCSHVLRASCSGCGKPLHADWVTCPHCGVRSADDAATAQAKAPIAAPAAERTFKALVVDDDPDLRRIVRLTLERSDLGLTVITAQDGREALALLEVERPDVVVLDLAMPGVDGFEVCRRLRADPRTALVPVLMLTAKDSTDSVTRGFRDGADDYVTKPFRRDDLIARVRRMIERAYGGEAKVNGTKLDQPLWQPGAETRAGGTG